MELIALVVVAVAAAGLGAVAMVWWYGRAATPDAVVPPPAVESRPALALVPPPTRLITIRCLDLHGNLVAEHVMEHRQRRPELHLHGAVFHAESHVGNDVWHYRWTRPS